MFVLDLSLNSRTYFRNKESDTDDKHDDWNNVILNDTNQNDMYMTDVSFVKYVLIFLEYL